MVEKENLFRVQAVASHKPWAAISALRPAQRQVTFLLRLSLAIVFFWFGVLKLIEMSPVVELLRSSFPVLARSPYLELLGLAEIIIAAGLLVDRLSKPAAALMILHLLGTLSVVWVSPALVFAPAFPVLTMAGEFLAKNVVFIMAGLVVLSSRER